MSQQKVWDSIAQPWKKFRVMPIKEVQEFLKNKKGNILDLGCGAGRNFVENKGIIYGVDFSKEMLKCAKEYSKKNNVKVKLKNAKATKLPFKDNFFDSAIFIAVLHCIPKKEDREKSLRELLRVLKPNAEALISVWDYNQKRFKDSKKEAFMSWAHKKKKYLRYYYLYEKKEFKDLLKKVGFKIIKIMDREKLFGLYSRKNIIAKVKKN